MAFEIIGKINPDLHRFHLRRLSDKDVLTIRERFIDGSTYRQLATEYGVSLKTIYNIIHLKTYTDIPLPPRYEDIVASIMASKKGRRS